MNTCLPIAHRLACLRARSVLLVGWFVLSSFAVAHAAAVKKAHLITGLDVQPARVAAGQPVQIILRALPQGTQFQLADSYPIAAALVPPGFGYDAAKKKSTFALNSSTSVTAGKELKHTFKLDTRNWGVGIHHYLLQALDAKGQPVDEAPLAINISDPKDHLHVTVEPSVPLTKGTHFGRFVKLRDGALWTAGQLSRDDGQTWAADTLRFGEGAELLRDGSVLGLSYECPPIANKEGWFATDRFLSKDGRTFEKSKAQFNVPEAKSAHGHSAHPGPLFMRSILERTNGTLVAYMAGWFKSDTAICPYGRERPYSRAYVCESSDLGLTWRYLATIGYEQLGSEGYNEGSMRRLPDGAWLTVMRTGSPSDINCQDSPIMWSVSRDEGRTWTKPARTGLSGCYPSLAVLSDGLVAMSYGRPGARVAFSADQGRTWTDATCVDATVYSGYTDVVELKPGELLVGFGTRGYLELPAGTRADTLRLARVRYGK